MMSQSFFVNAEKIGNISRPAISAGGWTIKNMLRNGNGETG